MALSAGTVIFSSCFSLLSPLDMSPPASISSLLLYPDGKRLLTQNRLRQVSQDWFEEEFSSIPENVVAV